MGAHPKTARNPHGAGRPKGRKSQVPTRKPGAPSPTIKKVDPPKAVTTDQRQASESLAQGSALAAASVADKFGAGATPGADATTAHAGGSPGISGAGAPDISYAQVIHQLNIVMGYKWPSLAMLPHEEKGIGEGLDLVIEKHWPSMKQLGPEAALAIAISGYGLRVWLELSSVSRGVPADNGTKPVVENDPARGESSPEFGPSYRDAPG